MGCFRPLTGIMVLIELKISADVIKATVLFPSPYGDYGSYQLPCLGKAGYLPTDVSVPLRGLWFLSGMGIRLFLYPVHTGFRPLTGIMVLITDV